MATYTYSLSGDFTNGVCIASLTSEIEAEGAITTGLTYIVVSPASNDDNVEIIFDSTLSGGEETALDGVVAAHDGSVCAEPDPPDYTLETDFENHTTNSGIHFPWQDVEDLAATTSGISGVYIKDVGVTVSGSPFVTINFINCLVDAADCWYDSDWLYMKKITIDHTLVEDNLTNFPVLIYLSADDDLAEKARSDGYDILFTSEDCQTKLNHERVSYSAGTLQAWVNIPSLSSSVDTVINMYYGNAGASDQQSAEATWNSNYKAVYHFENSFLDSTSNNNDGSNNGSSDITGKAGRARDFSGTSQYISVPHNGTLDITTQLTVELWANLANSGNNQKILSNVNNSINRGFMLAVQNNDLYPEVWNSSGSNHTFDAGTISSNTWTYLAITCQVNGNLLGYINDGQFGSTAFGSTNIGTNTDDMVIGAAGWDPTAFETDGSIDEIRISNTVRSAQWLATCYNNQNNPSSFYSLGIEIIENAVSIASVCADTDLTTYYAEDDSESSTSSTSWQQKLRLTLTNIPAGSYEIEWYAELYHTDTGSAASARVQRDDSTTIAQARYYAASGWALNYQAFGGIKHTDLSAGSYTYDLDYTVGDNSGGSTSAYIRRARLLVTRLA